MTIFKDAVDTVFKLALIPLLNNKLAEIGLPEITEDDEQLNRWIDEQNDHDLLDSYFLASYFDDALEMLKCFSDTEQLIFNEKITQLDIAAAADGINSVNIIFDERMGY